MQDNLMANPLSSGPDGAPFRNYFTSTGASICLLPPFRYNTSRFEIRRKTGAMDLEPWNPWREFETIRTEVDRIFERFFAKVRQLGGDRPITFFPTTDVIETGEDLRVFLSLPGCVEEDIEIALEGGTLVVRGEREAPYDPGRCKGHIEEWRYGYFERRIELPADVDPEGLSGAYQGGVLTIVVPKRKG
jgi:HSP20 family protein